MSSVETSLSRSNGYNVSHLSSEQQVMHNGVDQDCQTSFCFTFLEYRVRHMYSRFSSVLRHLLSDFSNRGVI
jgi:hypothetical protein